MAAQHERDLDAAGQLPPEDDFRGDVPASGGQAEWYELGWRRERSSLTLNHVWRS